MRYIFLALTFLLSVALTQQPVSANTEQIAVVVNQDAISSSDVQERIEMVMASSGLPNNNEIREKLTGQVVNSLIDEQLKIQEARRLDIEVTEEEVKRGFAAIAEQNRMKVDDFMTMLKRQNISTKSMEHQIRSQIAWTKVVQNELRPKISVSQKDIESALNRLKANQGKTEYLVAEIYLPVEDPKEEQDVKQLANRLADQINNAQASFFKVAQEFSKAAGSFNGGDLGWISEDQLASELSESLVKLNKGDISRPIRSLNGYHILLLRDQRTMSEETLPTREQIISDIGLQRLERLQQRHLMDLKSSAFIESRV